MYSVKVRDHIMIAHSLKRQIFGQAQNVHGATYVVDVEFFSQELNKDGIVLDIGEAHDKLKNILDKLNYQNLDEHPYFKEVLSTTENIAKYIHDCLSKAIYGLFAGKIKVTLRESPTAWASYGED